MSGPSILQIFDPTVAASGNYRSLKTTDLASGETAEEIASQGRSANEITLSNIALTTSPAQLPSIVLRHGAVVSIQNPDGSGQTVYVGRANTITAALSVDSGKATWQIAEGTAEDFGGQNANEWWVCATGSMTAAYRVEGRSS